MNEETKDIETCLPENILSEVANVPTDPQFRSLVEESFDPLQQQALQQAGYDGYKEVVMYHQPYTFTSQVKQMKSNLILLLRRLWRFPFGRGTTASSSAGSASAAAPIRSLADMWQHYITRLKGNAEYGIPSRLSSLTDLPSAPALLADRKISGVPEAVDGMSLVHLILRDNASITELLDDNTWDILQRDLKTLTDLFPNVHKLTLGMEEISNRYIASYNLNGITDFNVPNLKRAIFCCVDRGFRLRTLTMPELTIYQGGDSSTYGFIGMVNGDTTVTKIECPNMKEFHFGRFAVDCPSLKEVITDIEVFDEYGGYLYMLVNCPNVEKLVFGKLRIFRMIEPQNRSGISDSAYLIHLEVGAGTYVSLNFRSWKPTTALSDNLQQFLSNFRDYIALRLTDNGSGLTLTLSQEVRNAIHAAEDEYGIENIIITQKGWTISPAPN